MPSLSADIAAFDLQSAELQAEHGRAWVVFHEGQLVGAFADFEAAASAVEERFDDEPCLIRQLGAGPVQLSGGLVFRPAHAFD